MYPSVPEESSVEKVHRREMAQAINRLNRGKFNGTGDITLTANAATTVLTDARLAQQSVVFFDPVTANAAAELAAGTLYVLLANRNRDAWTIAHANNAQADRTFRYLIIG